MRLSPFGVICAAAMVLSLATLNAPLCAEPGAAVEDESVTASRALVRVVKLRIVIDDAEYTWQEGGILESTGVGVDTANPVEKSALLPGTVVSFLSVAPGLAIPVNELERRCRESELRLAESGYVYAADVQVIPSKKDADARTVLVTVSSGFLWRFGGGGIYGLVGKDGLGGERASARMYFGWNKNGGELMHYRAFGLPLVLGARAFWLGPGAYSGLRPSSGLPDAGTRFEAGSTVGMFLHPDVIAAVDEAFGFEGPENGAAPVFSLQPNLRYRKFIVPDSAEKYGNESDFGFDVRGFFFPRKPAMKKGEISGFIHGNVMDATMLALKVSSGASSGGAGFDLFLTEDRSVRSGYAASALFAESFAFASFELRQSLLTFTVPPGFGCESQGFAFADAASLVPFSSSDRFCCLHEICDAYGVGLRVLFDSPVFAYFTFSYGVNHEGQGRFLFCGTAGF